MTAPEPQSPNDIGLAFSDTHVFFDGGDFARRLDLLRHLSQSSDLILLVVGAPGSGKSTLLECFCALAAEGWQVCSLPGSAETTASALLRQLAQCCGLPADGGEAASIMLLFDYAADLVRDDRIPLIVVDDAHLLNRQALAVLIELGSVSAGNAHPWHIAMFSQPGLDAVLVNGHGTLPPTEHLHVIRLAPLSAADTAAYVRFRLAAAGLQDRVQVSDEQLRRLHRDSGGLPASINALATTRLGRGVVAPAVPNEPVPPGSAHGPAPGRRRVTGVVLAVLALAALVLALVFQDRINAVFEARSTPLASGAAPLAKQPAPVPSPDVARPPPTPLAEQASGSKPATNVESSVAAPSAPVDAALPPSADQGGSSAPRPSITPAPSAPVDASLPPAAASADHANASEPQTGVAPPQSAAGAAVSEFAPQSQDAPTLALQATVQAPAETVQPATAAIVQAPAAPGAVEPKRSPAADSTSSPALAPRTPPTASTAERAPVAAAENRHGLPARGQKWILQQAPAHFTLQLLAARQARTIRQFLAAHRDLSAEVAYFQVTDRGRPWRVLIYGAFATKSAARKAAQDLASRSKGTRTWIRAYKHIQDQIRAGRR